MHLKSCFKGLYSANTCHVVAEGTVTRKGKLDAYLIQTLNFPCVFFLCVWLNSEMYNEELALFHPLHLLSSDTVVVCYSSQVQKGTYRATVLISLIFSVESPLSWLLHHSTVFQLSQYFAWNKTVN